MRESRVERGFSAIGPYDAQPRARTDHDKKPSNTRAASMADIRIGLNRDPTNRHHFGPTTWRATHSRRRYMRGLAKALVAVGAFALFPATVFAQATITGVVKDTSGAVLPGVSVEAASPDIIEKVRTAVTD